MTSLLPIRTLLILVLTLAVQACRSDDPVASAGVFFPTVPIGDAYPAGEIEGTFELRSGCLFVVRPEGGWLLLWPEGFTAREAAGRIDVVDPSGALVAREGGPVRFGGGERRGERAATDLTGQDVPDRCGDLFWLVSPPAF